MKITVLTGGTSTERDVALASAVQVVSGLRKSGHEVTVVDTTRGFIPRGEESSLLPESVGASPPSTAALTALAALERGLLISTLGEIPAVRDADAIFLALHGGWGEDGTIQAVLEVIGVPYTGSGVLGSALAMDKDLSKKLFRTANIPTAAWAMAPLEVAESERRFGWPVVVKPSKQGSTVGLTLVKRRADYEAAIELAARYDDESMIEAFVPGREITVGILDDQALPVGEIIPKHEIFDYECKYTPGMSQEIFPAKLSPAVAAEAQRLALDAHRALKLGGYSRVDFRLTADGNLFCLEVNTLPGLTGTSLLPQAARAAGIDFPALCDRICRTARLAGRREGSRS